MITSKTPHAQTYSYSKFNQSLVSARLYYKQGAYEKAFDAFIMIYKNVGILLEPTDLYMVGQSLVSLFGNVYQQPEKFIDHFCSEIDKLTTLDANESGPEFVKAAITPLFNQIIIYLSEQEGEIQTFAAYRKIINRVSQSVLIPVELETKLMNQENKLCQNIMRSIKRWYEQKLYILAATQAYNEIQRIDVFYPKLAKHLLSESIILFKRHNQCPNILIEQFKKMNFSSNSSANITGVSEVE